MRFQFSIVFYLIAITSCKCQPCFPTKLDSNQFIITSEDKSGTALRLFDEQQLSGDPLATKGGAPKSNWFPGWTKTIYPARMIINLQNPVKISSFFLRDVENNGLFTIESGTPGHWTLLVSDSLKNYQSWNKHMVETTTQYLRFTKMSGSSNVAEVVLYGCLLPDGGPPDPVIDLRTTVVTDTAIKIIWTATGDDGKMGSAKKYDIRYSRFPINTVEDFSAATSVENEPSPAYSGTIQSYLVRGLSSETTYYFALREIDDMDQKSELSNTISVSTKPVNLPQRITMDKFIGANAFVDDPIDKMQAVGFIREYHNWRWDEGGAKSYTPYPNNKLQFAPSSAGEGSWDFDRFYTKVNDAGLEISPVIQGTVNWLQGQTEFPFDEKPLDTKNDDPTTPASFQAKANHIYQFAARYGRTKVSEESLTLANDQSKVSGLNLIEYLEDWNEPNKDWRGKNAEFLPEEYAAMASANYDGHGNTIHNGSKSFGLKNADPKMKFVMGGIASLDLKWIEQMQRWFENYRPDNQFIPDVINVHHYSWKNGNGWQGGGPAKSPEEDNFKDRLKAIVEYRDSHLPNVEVWISEFGYDTNPGSPLCPPKIGTFDLQEIQGQWLVRAYLAFAAAGVDRAQMYMLRDVDPKSARWFNSSGLTGPKGDWTPKKSWYYVYTLKNTLKNMVFIGEDQSSDSNVLIYKFRSIQNGKGAYVIWSKTNEQKEITDFKFQLSDTQNSVQLVQLSEGETSGITTILPIENNAVKLVVTERPCFVLVDNIH